MEAQPEAIGLPPALPLPAPAQGSTPLTCALPVRSEPVLLDSETLQQAPVVSSGTASIVTQTSQQPLPPTADPAAHLPPDYRLRLRPTELGWPILRQWCVWVEPPAEGPTPDRWQQRWSEAVDQALTQWSALLPLQRVERQEAAQIRLLRRRPPRQPGVDGRLRASHGRALLSLRQVDRGQGLRLEPMVEVLLSPDQRQEALRATALHELGHALGLWGHSEADNDVMAARPGPKPILVFSARDRATLEWLYSQPTRFGHPLSRPQGKPAGGVSAGASPGRGR
ncbi:MAG: matrixin family metalloprotease [Synechococcaceae cyanobacterium]|nr:matrixin family metalloprotease [Synechococcaceae cyanobacterium]